jgi:hypothetical protein
MASYWIIVRRENPDLLDTLSVAFRGKTGFCVVADRRRERPRRRRGPGERRGTPPRWGPDEVIVAERIEPMF